MEHPASKSNMSSQSTASSSDHEENARLANLQRHRANIIRRIRGHQIQRDGGGYLVPGKWPIPEHLILEFIRSTIRRLWPYARINARRSRPPESFPRATRYWIISCDNPIEAFGASMGGDWAAKINSRRRWQRIISPAKNKSWFRSRSTCHSQDTAGQEQSEEDRLGIAWTPNMLERRWLLNLLYNQMSFNIPQKWRDHIEFESSRPIDNRASTARNEAPWMRVRYPQGTLCISIEFEDVSERIAGGGLCFG